MGRFRYLQQSYGSRVTLKIMGFVGEEVGVRSRGGGLKILRTNWCLLIKACVPIDIGFN